MENRNWTKEESKQIISYMKEHYEFDKDEVLTGYTVCFEGSMLTKVGSNELKWNQLKTPLLLKRRKSS